MPYAALGVIAGCIVAFVSRGAKPWQLKNWYEQLYVDLAAVAAAAWVASCNRFHLAQPLQTSCMQTADRI